MQDADFLKLPRAQVDMGGLELPPDIDIVVGMSQPHIRGYSRPKVKLRISRGGLQGHVIFFDGHVPRDLLKGTAASGIDLFDAFCGESHALDFAANRAFTPSAKLAIKRPGCPSCSTDLSVTLKIGEWSGIARESSIVLGRLFNP